MLRIEEQMKEVNRRREIYTHIKKLQKKIIGEIFAGLICVMLAVTVACSIPALGSAAEQTPVRQYGSMILAVPTVGYVLVSILFFILGIVVTLLCQHYKMYKEKERDI